MYTDEQMDWETLGDRHTWMHTYIWARGLEDIRRFTNAHISTCAHGYWEVLGDIDTLAYLHTYICAHAKRDWNTRDTDTLTHMQMCTLTHVYKHIGIGTHQRSQTCVYIQTCKHTQAQRFCGTAGYN